MCFYHLILLALVVCQFTVWVHVDQGTIAAQVLDLVSLRNLWINIFWINETTVFSKK